MVTSRIMFPHNETLDPSIKVRVRLSSVVDNSALSEESFELYEKGDIGEPKAVWDAEQVRVTGMYRQKEVVLPLPST